MNSDEPRVAYPAPDSEPLKKPFGSAHNPAPANLPTTQTPDKQPASLSRRTRILDAGNLHRRSTYTAAGDSNTKSARRHLSSSWDEDADAAEISTPIPQIRQEALLECFTSLVTSIRLLGLKGAHPSFTNISPKVESLTKEEFSYRNLAQLKYIFPEAIEITKALKFGERTGSMIPELRVSLNLDSVAPGLNLEESSPYMALGEAFRNRLADFCRDHPEDVEVPAAMLPHPFNQLKQVNEMVVETAAGPLVDAAAIPLDELKPVAAASHFPPDFRPCLSKRAVKVEAGTHGSSTEADCSALLLSSPVEGDSGVAEHLSKPCCLPPTPSKVTVKRDQPMATPAKNVESAAGPSESIMCTTTPAASCPPRRCYMTPGDDEGDNDDVIYFSANKLTRPHPVRTRSLKFDTNPDDVSADKNNAAVPKSPATMVRENDNEEEGAERPCQQEMMASLLRVFNTVQSLFQLGRGSVMTKEEVIHKIIAQHLDVVDKGEVEEQLKLLAELLPEWISEKTAFSGDMVFYINKTASTEAMRARLEGVLLQQQDAY
ncbi:unnamed protein product [Linum trigynum]|uniref:CDT1 Geminin-binding domain-containing protein n=1 Tax=Linum trigynum TaxID=586398 RepID=A0AAV2CA23_9ROSI